MFILHIIIDNYCYIMQRKYIYTSILGFLFSNYNQPISGMRICMP